jgi:hypothetical protein
MRIAASSPFFTYSPVIPSISEESPALITMLYYNIFPGISEESLLFVSGSRYSLTFKSDLLPRNVFFLLIN